jgi:hypothetical protein
MARPGWYNENSGRDFPFVFARDGETLRDTPDVFVDFGCVVGIHADFVDGESQMWLQSLRKVGAYIEIDFYSDAPGLVNHKLQFSREFVDDNYEIEYAQSVPTDYTSISVSEVEASYSPSYCEGDVLWEGFLVTKAIDKLASLFDTDRQTMRPVSTTWNNTFTPLGGASLWEVTSDQNNSTYAYSNWPSTAQNFVVKLGGIEWPDSGPVVIRWTITADPAASQVRFRLYSVYGGTIVNEWIENSPPTVITDFEYTLTGEQVALIDNWNDIHVLAQVIGTAVPQPLLLVHEISLEVPAPLDQEITFGPGNLVVEPGLTQNLAGHYMSTVNIYNAERTRGERVAGCTPWCWPDSRYGTYQHWAVATCLVGDIRIAEGYNCTIEEDTYNNRLTVHAEVGKGLGEPPGEVPINPSEGYPEYGSYLDGSVGCDEVVRSMNGIEGPHVEIIGGQGITVDTIPGQHLIIVKIDMQDLTGCFEQEASTSLSEYTPDPDPCACGEE